MVNRVGYVWSKRLKITNEAIERLQRITPKNRSIHKDVTQKEISKIMHMPDSHTTHVITNKTMKI